MKKQNAVQFQFVDIKTEDYATFKDNFLPKVKSFDLSIDLDVKIKSTQFLVGIFPKFTFSQQHLPVLQLLCSCHFKLEKDYWNAQIKGDKLTLSKDLISHLLVLTIGTARGIIHEKKPNWLDTFILPTLDVSDMIHEDMVFNLSTQKEEEEEE